MFLSISPFYWVSESINEEMVLKTGMKNGLAIDTTFCLFTLALSTNICAVNNYVGILYNLAGTCYASLAVSCVLPSLLTVDSNSMLHASLHLILLPFSYIISRSHTRYKNILDLWCEINSCKVIITVFYTLSVKSNGLTLPLLNQNM